MPATSYNHDFPIEQPHNTAFSQSSLLNSLPPHRDRCQPRAVIQQTPCRRKYNSRGYETTCEARHCSTIRKISNTSGTRGGKCGYATVLSKESIPSTTSTSETTGATTSPAHLRKNADGTMSNVRSWSWRWGVTRINATRMLVHCRREIPWRSSFAQLRTITSPITPSATIHQM